MYLSRFIFVFYLMQRFTASGVNMCRNPTITNQGSAG